MPPPASGLLKIFPGGTTIVNGDFALNSDASPQPDRPASDLTTYYDARVTNLAIAPCFRRNPVNPVAGDYELQFSSSSLRIEFYNTYPGAIVDTLDFINADFPTGMVIIQPRIYWTGQIFSANTIMDLKYFGSTIHSFQFSNGNNVGGIASGINDIIGASIRWSIIQLMRPFGFHVNYNVASAIGCITSEFFIIAEYNTLSFSTTLATPLAIPGEIADITDANSNLGVFSSYKIYWDINTDLDEEASVNFPSMTGGVTIPTRYFFIRTANRIKFQIPEDLGIPYGGRRLMLVGVGNGVQFVGEFPIANLNLLLVDGSGVYHLENGQRHDTYYDRSVTPPVTTNLKFPRPGFRTGFF